MNKDDAGNTPEKQGYAAYLAGKRSTDDPFEVGSADSKQWIVGWLRGEDGSPGHPAFGVRIWRFRIRGDHIVLFAIGAVVARYFFWDQISRLSEQPGQLAIFVLAMLAMVGIVTYSGPPRR